MKKTIFIVIGVMLFLAQLQPGKVLAQESISTKQKAQHNKPVSTLTGEQIEQAKQDLVGNSPEKETTKTSSNTVSISSTKNLQQLSVKSELTPSSLATPTLLDMDYFYSYVIAAAVAKNHRNIQSNRNGYNPIYYYYDNLGDLDYVNNSTGTKIADVSYCDGSEVYNCPVGWVDWIDFAPLSSHDYLEFYYSQDTPSVDYYASLSGEPDLFFYNLNMATGTSPFNLSDPLYEGDGYSKILVDLSQISGYVQGNPINPNWLLKLYFPSNRLISISDMNASKTATFTSSPSSSIHRFWSNAKQGHFFTSSESEKAGIIANDPSWKYESVAYMAVDSKASQATPVYRFWSNSKQRHFFTVNATEKDGIIANDKSWSYEAIAYYAYASQMPNTTPVYRFWSDVKKGHFFTSLESEKAGIIANDPSWKYEGIAWYVPTN